jgi:hypothetical protein
MQSGFPSPWLKWYWQHTGFDATPPDLVFNFGTFRGDRDMFFHRRVDHLHHIAFGIFCRDLHRMDGFRRLQYALGDGGVLGGHFNQAIDLSRFFVDLLDAAGGAWLSGRVRRAHHDLLGDIIIDCGSFDGAAIGRAHQDFFLDTRILGRNTFQFLDASLNHHLLFDRLINSRRDFYAPAFWFDHLAHLLDRVFGDSDNVPITRPRFGIG